VYNVAVGEDKPIGSEYKSRSAAIALARLSITLPFSREPEERNLSGMAGR
jgi:hypothetical protein